MFLVVSFWMKLYSSNFIQYWMLVVSFWMKLYSFNFIQYWMLLVVSFLMIILRLYFHPILDVSCDPSLDDNLRLYFHPILDVSCDPS